MRKAILCLLIIGLLLGGIFQQAQAQDTKQDVNLNIGGLTNQSFMGPIYTLGAGADIHLGKHIMISPELQLWSSELRLDVLQLNLGATLNYKLKIFFVGGGINIPFFMTTTFTDVFGIIGPKINVGLRINRIKLTIYLLTSFEDFFDYFQVGANIGIVFNIKSP